MAWRAALRPPVAARCSIEFVRREGRTDGHTRQALACCVQGDASSLYECPLAFSGDSCPANPSRLPAGFNREVSRAGEIVRPCRKTSTYGRETLRMRNERNGKTSRNERNTPWCAGCSILLPGGPEPTAATMSTAGSGRVRSSCLGSLVRYRKGRRRNDAGCLGRRQRPGYPRDTAEDSDRAGSQCDRREWNGRPFRHRRAAAVLKKPYNIEDLLDGLRKLGSWTERTPALVPAHGRICIRSGGIVLRERRPDRPVGDSAEFRDALEIAREGAEIGGRVMNDEP